MSELNMNVAQPFKINFDSWRPLGANRGINLAAGLADPTDPFNFSFEQDSLTRNLDDIPGKAVNAVIKGSYLPTLDSVFDPSLLGQANPYKISPMGAAELQKKEDMEIAQIRAGLGDDTYSNRLKNEGRPLLDQDTGADPNPIIGTVETAPGDQSSFTPIETISSKINGGDSLPSTGGDGTEPTFWQKAFGWSNKKTGEKYNGWFQPVVSGVTSVGNIALGVKQLKNSEEALEQQEEMFNKNFEMQTEMLNRRLQAREYTRARMQGATEEQAQKKADRYVEKSGAGKF
jgi:hypothetical protein